MEIIIYCISVVITTGLLYWVWSFEKDAVTLGTLAQCLLIILMPIANTILAVLGGLAFVGTLVSAPTFWNKVIIKGKQ